MVSSFIDKRYAIIGCGMMGQEHIRNLGLLDGATVVALYDPVLDQLAEAKALAPDALPYTDLPTLLNTSGIDALVVASPNHTHVSVLEMIADAPHRPVLCEKPLLIGGQEAPFKAFAAGYSAPIWVAMEYRYMSAINRLIEQVDAVTGGVKLLSIREHRFPFLKKVGDWNRFNRNSGGTLVEKCCHFFDLMRLILGAEPVRVMATAGQVINHLDEQYDGEVPDIWDAGYVAFDFDNGARAMLELCMFADGSIWQEEISAVGPVGKIEARVPGPPRFWPTDRLGPQPDAQVTLSPRESTGAVTDSLSVDPSLNTAGDHHGSTFYQHQKFLDVVRGIGDVEVTWQDGFKAVAMGVAAQKAAESATIISLK